jgi:hypothetical protein
LQLQLSGDTVFETLAVLTTLSLAVIFAALVRMEYRSRQQDDQERKTGAAPQ